MRGAAARTRGDRGDRRGPRGVRRIECDGHTEACGEPLRPPTTAAAATHQCATAAPRRAAATSGRLRTSQYAGNDRDDAPATTGRRSQRRRTGQDLQWQADRLGHRLLHQGRRRAARPADGRLGQGEQGRRRIRRPRRLDYDAKVAARRRNGRNPRCRDARQHERDLLRRAEPPRGPDRCLQ